MRDEEQASNGAAEEPDSEAAAAKVNPGSVRATGTIPPGVTSKSSWRDWLPEGYPEPPNDQLITRAELLERLRGIFRTNLSEKRLQLWEAAGVLPGPVRRWHNGATRALYPRWVVYVAAIAELDRPGDLSMEALAEKTRALTRQAIHYYDSHTWDVMQGHLPDALGEVADHYEAAMGERPAVAEVRIRREDGQSLYVYYVDIPPRHSPT